MMMMMIIIIIAWTTIIILMVMIDDLMMMMMSHDYIESKSAPLTYNKSGPRGVSPSYDWEETPAQCDAVSRAGVECSLSLSLSLSRTFSLAH